MKTDLMIQERFFIGYVRTALRRYAWRWRKTMCRRHAKEPLLLNEKIFYDDGSSCERINMIAGTFSVEESLFLSLPLNQVTEYPGLARGLSELTEVQRKVLKGLIVDEVTQEVMAVKLGISQQAVCKTKSAIIHKLRDACQTEGGVIKWRRFSRQ